MRIFHKECVSAARAGYEVFIVAPVERPFEELGIKVLPAGIWKNRLHRILVTVPRVLRQALGIKADIYHFHDPELLLIAPALRLTGARVIYDVHEDYETSIPTKQYLPGLLRNPLARAAGHLEKIAARCCHIVVAEKYYRERFAGATEVLNYPLTQDTESLLPGAGLEEFDGHYDWLLYTGNVTTDRGALTHLNFLEANDRTALAYIGKCRSPLAESIGAQATARGIAPQRIKFIGIDSYVAPELINHYSNQGKWLAGVALFPRSPHYERKELTKFFEYMAAGLPVVASDFDAWKNIIEGNNCGVCVDPDDLVGISAAISSLQADPSLALTMGRNGAIAVSRKYNWPGEARKLTALYHDLQTG